MKTKTKYTLLDTENYFDQAEALHTVCTLYHDGQTSKKYELLSRSKFRPGPCWSEGDVIRDNYCYNEVAEYSDDELEVLLNELETYLNEKEEADYESST